MKKFLAILLIAMFAVSSLACLAAGSRDEYNYETKDAQQHTVYKTVWDGETESGRGVTHEETYDEAHDFDDKGVCTKCHYTKEVPEVGVDALAVLEAETEAEAVTFTTKTGVELTKGEAVADVLKKVFASIPEGSEVIVVGVDDEVASRLLEALKNGATSAELLVLLADFPVQPVDGVECYVVTLQYNDENGVTVTERFAFSIADGSLVSVF